MNPEISRVSYYRNLYNIDFEKVYDDVKNVFIVYNDEKHIQYELVQEIMTVLDALIITLGDSINYTEFITKTDVYFIDDKTVFILLDVDDTNFGLFVGRGKNNLFALKRLLSNLSGKYGKITGDKFSLTLDIKQLMH